MTITKRQLKRPHPETGRKYCYMVRVEGKRDPITGKRKQYARQVGTEREAKQLQADWISEIARGTAVDPNKVTISELMALWLDTKRGEVSPNSLQDYDLVIRVHINPVLGDTRVQELTAAALQRQYAEWQKQGMSARMIRGCYMRLSQALDMAVRLGIVYANAAKSTKPPRLQRGSVEAWTQAEAAAFLAQAQAMPVLNHGDTGRREIDPLWPLWPLLLAEGLRRGEGCGLRWRDVDLERGTAHIVQSVAPDKSNKGAAVIQDRVKTGSSARTVRLTDFTVQALKAHRDRQSFARKAAGDQWKDNDLIVSTRYGAPINPANVTRSFNRILKLTKLPDGTPVKRIAPHGLRHSCASLLLRAGVHPKIVQERLGHASIAITMDLYSHSAPDSQDAAAAALDAMFRVGS